MFKPIIIISMKKNLFVLLLLVASTLQQDLLTTSTEITEEDAGQLPGVPLPVPPTPNPNFPDPAGGGNMGEIPPSSPPGMDGSSSGEKATSPSPTQTFQFRISQPTDWTFLEQDTLGAGSQWRFPSGNFQMKPKGYIVSYKIKFHTDCLKNVVLLKWAATGHSFVSLNGQFIRIWAAPYPNSIHNLVISTSQLLCGCNQIKIQVYNYQGESPAALVYQLSQSKKNCYLCQNTGVTFYNRSTCKCECSSTCDCKQNMSWVNYPKCGCVCSRSLKCPSGKYFHRQKCSCDCQPRCCKKGYFQSTVSCNCIKFPVLVANNNFLSSTIQVNP